MVQRHVTIELAPDEPELVAGPWKECSVGPYNDPAAFGDALGRLAVRGPCSGHVAGIVRHLHTGQWGWKTVVRHKSVWVPSRDLAIRQADAELRAGGWRLL